MRALIDTNIILDFFLTREPQYEAAKKIFELAYKSEINAYATSSSITDIYYVTAKRIGDSAARDALRNLFNLLAIITVDGEDCFTALDLPIKDYEDALVVACAKKTDMDFIVTNDSAFLDADNHTTRIISSAAFLQMLGEDPR